MPIIEKCKNLNIGQAIGGVWVGHDCEDKYWIQEYATQHGYFGQHVRPDGTTQEVAWWFDTREEVDVAIRLYDQKHRSLDWHDELVALVKDCIEQQRKGFDVLASSAWGRVVEHWGDAEITKPS